MLPRPKTFPTAISANTTFRWLYAQWVLDERDRIAWSNTSVPCPVGNLRKQNFPSQSITRLNVVRRVDSAWPARLLASASIIDYEIAPDKANERLALALSIPLPPREGWFSRACQSDVYRCAGWLSDYRMTGRRQCATHTRNTHEVNVSLSRHPTYTSLCHAIRSRYTTDPSRSNTPFYTCIHTQRTRNVPCSLSYSLPPSLYPPMTLHPALRRGGSVSLALSVSICYFGRVSAFF